MLALMITAIVVSILAVIIFSTLEKWNKRQSAQDEEIKHLKNVIDHDHDAIRALRHDVDHQHHSDDWSAWTKPLNPNKDSHSAFDEKS